MEKPKKADNLGYKIFLGAVGLLVLCALSFYGGIHYQKGKQPSSTAATGQPASAAAGGIGGRFGGRFGGQRPNFGSVTAVSATSITITSAADSSSKTFSIDSSTQITDNGQTVTFSDIQTGDNVIIRTSSSTSTTASQILVNPGFGSGAGAAPSGGSSSGSSSI